MSRPETIIGTFAVEFVEGAADADAFASGTKITVIGTLSQGHANEEVSVFVPDASGILKRESRHVTNIQQHFTLTSNRATAATLRLAMYGDIDADNSDEEYDAFKIMSAAKANRIGYCRLVNFDPRVPDRATKPTWASLPFKCAISPAGDFAPTASQAGDLVLRIDPMGDSPVFKRRKLTDPD